MKQMKSTSTAVSNWCGAEERVKIYEKFQTLKNAHLTASKGHKCLEHATLTVRF
jgi:hypothetical protein